MAAGDVNRRMWRWLALAGLGGIAVAFVALEFFDTSMLTAQQITGVSLSVWFVALARSKRLRGLRGAAAFVLVAVNVGDVAGVLPHLVALPLSLPLGLAIIWAPEPPAPASASGGATPR